MPNKNIVQWLDRNTADYAWVITHDHTAGKDEPAGTNENAKGVIGPSNAFLLKSSHIKSHAFTRKFKMYDDNGELYYSGVIALKNVDDDGSELLFAPLEDYGTPNAGATRIDYLNPTTQKWETL